MTTIQPPLGTVYLTKVFHHTCVCILITYVITLRLSPLPKARQKEMQFS